MAEHITMTALRRALSASAKVNEKVAGDFLSALFGTIEQGLLQDSEVIVNGLGVFKLQQMPARQSVNVVSGERITIEGYNKVILTPITTRVTTNKKTNEPADPIKKLGEQAVEIKGILDELNAISEQDTIHHSSPKETLPALEQEYAVYTPQEEKSEASEVVSTKEENTQVEEKPIAAPTIASPSMPSDQQDTPTQKPFNPWLTGIITVGVFAMLLVIAYFVLRHQIVHWAENMRTTLEQRVNTQEQTSNNTSTTTLPPISTDDSELSTEQDKSQEGEQTQAASATTPNYYNDSERTFTEFQATEIVGQDSRLAWVAKKNYGKKELWVFIYEANRDILTRPDFVTPGMELRIPKLPAELTDINNPETAALLERLSQKYLNR